MLGFRSHQRKTPQKEKSTTKEENCVMLSTQVMLVNVCLSVYLTLEAPSTSLINHLKAAAGLDLLEVQLTETTSPALFVDRLP